MAKLLDEHVSLRQCERAVKALHAHQTKREEKQQETELLPRKEQHFWLVVSVKQIYTRKKIMPFKIPVVHSLVDPHVTPVCLITKDPQREYKDLLEAKKIEFISRVVGITKLKGKFKPFEAKRLLLKENGMFLADERVIPLLPGLLGSKFFKAKKQPIPVCLTRTDLKAELERAISSTYMHQNLGTCTSIKIGLISHTPAQILSNLKSALPAVVANVKGGWSNIQNIQIKTDSSISLPIWNCSLDDTETGRWGGGWKGVGQDEESEEVEIPTSETEGSRTDVVSKKRKLSVSEGVPSGRVKPRPDQPASPARDVHDVDSKKQGRKKESSKAPQSISKEATSARKKRR